MHMVENSYCFPISKTSKFFFATLELLSIYEATNLNRVYIMHLKNLLTRTSGKPGYVFSK